MKSPIISVIMPMYNASDIEENISEAIGALNSLRLDYELILVDDGSTNDCFFRAKKIKHSKLKVVGYRKNKGKGNAIKYGFGYASGNFVAFVDSGRDINPYQIGNFIRIMKDNQADIVIGSKRHPDSKVHYPLTRRFMSKVYQTINRFLFNLNVQDTQVGLKLFTHSILDKVFPRVAVKRFAFDLELLVIATKFGAKIIEAPVEIRYQFKSTINAKAVFWMLWDTAAIFYRDKIIKYYSRRI